MKRIQKPNSSNGKLHSEYARLDARDVFLELKSSENGLSEEEASIRQNESGLNEPSKKKHVPFIRQFLSKFSNPLVIMLVIIALFSLFFGEKISAIFVFFMIMISVILDFFQEYRSEKAVEKLNELVKTKITAIRSGEKQEIDIKYLVPGDIVDLYAGDMIPADVRIISCKDLFVNQASLTGESFPVEKTDQKIIPQSNSIGELKNMAFMGSSVVSGTGIAVCVKTGPGTKFGEISSSLAMAPQTTSFERGIRDFTMLMIKFIVILVVFIFGVIMLFKSGSFTEALLFSLAVAVGLTPEMLPMLVTVNLSNGAKVMSKKKVIVKRLSSIQNFGAMDIFCTDKTGTLTLDKIVLEHHFDVTGKEDEDVLRYAYINSYYQTGLKNILDIAVLNHEKLDVEPYRKIDEIPFDFSRKIMSVIVESEKRHLLVTKGAPEEIYARCTQYELHGKVHDLDAEILKKLKKEYEIFSRQGFRVLAVAYKNFPVARTAFSKNDEKDLVLKGYVAFLDPPKPEVRPVLNQLEKLGIEIKILTGDNELVTEKICSDAGVPIKGIATGDEIHKLNDDELTKLVEKTTIFARLDPLDKERIIRALHKNKHTVGYLGDGINDSPSLKAADVGISVDNAVDIAKESADIILLEKSLFVLVDGVVEGRKVFGNIIKYVKMGSSSNFGNMLSMTGAVLFLPFLPMLPIQILLNNFLYDISQLSIPSDSVDNEYCEKPRPWNINLIKKFMVIIGPMSSIFDFLTFGVMLLVFQAQPELFHTGWFIESLCTQTLVIYIIRTNKIPFVHSRPSRRLMISTIAILLFAGFLPFSPLAQLLGFVPLPPLYFAILAAMIAAYLVLVQVVKTMFIRKYGY